MDSTLSAIDAFANLKDGWDFGEGIVISNEVISKAKDIYLIGRNYQLEAEPHPTPDGGVCLVFYYRNNDFFLDININSDNTVDFKEEKGFGVNYETLRSAQNITVQELEKTIVEIRTKCNISDFFQFGSILSKSIDSKAIHSKTTREVSQLLTTNVQYKTLNVLASMLQDTIVQGQQDFQLFIQ